MVCARIFPNDNLLDPKTSGGKCYASCTRNPAGFGFSKSPPSELERRYNACVDQAWTDYDLCVKLNPGKEADCRAIRDKHFADCDTMRAGGKLVGITACGLCGIDNIAACIACVGEFLTRGLKIVAVNAGFVIVGVIGLYVLAKSERF